MDIGLFYTLLVKSPCLPGHPSKDRHDHAQLFFTKSLKIKSFQPLILTFVDWFPYNAWPFRATKML